MQGRFALCEGSVMDVARSFYLVFRQDVLAEAVPEASRVEWSGIAYATAANDNLRVKDRLSARCGCLLRRLICQHSGSLPKAKAVMAKMREMPINDFFAKDGKLREDGRMVHDMYLVEVKTPGESSGPWDYYKIIATIPGDQAFRPAGEDGCPLIKR
jgi:hypothetical protein